MDDLRVGSIVRAVRIKRGVRQSDVASGAGVARSLVSMIERGHLDGVSLAELRAVAKELEIRLELVALWRGGEAAKVVNERHARMHELMAERLQGASGWLFETEVGFSIWGERGTIDILAWHPARRILLIIELKTEIPDPAGLVAQVGRYRRLSTAIARERGWDPATVATWVIVAESDLNRRQLARHRVMLRNAFPADGRAFRRLLRDPLSMGETRSDAEGADASADGSRGRGSDRENGAATRDRVHGSAQRGVAEGGIVPGGPSGLGFLADVRVGSTNGRLGPTKRVRARTSLAADADGVQERGNPPSGGGVAGRIRSRGLGVSG